MRIIPVLDLKAGEVVRGIAGRRHDYRPIVSRLTPSSRPMDVARAFHDHFGLTELYMADLDAIAGSPAAFETYAAIRSLDFNLWVDAGVCDRQATRLLVEGGVEKVVIGLETVAGPQALERIYREFEQGEIAFSLDLKDGMPLGDTSKWAQPAAWSIAMQAITTGVQCLIVLDLARVGVNGGIGTEELCRQLAEQFPDVEIIAGGGIRGIEDLRRLHECGAKAALVASALHDGKLSPEDVLDVQRWSGRHS
jgi:phosphoribosylformimino-5-aminoimidazole carboxamide ribotide isomerase